MRSLLSLLLIAVAVVAQAQSVTLPPEVRGEPGEFIVVNAETTDTLVKWHVIDKGINLFPQQLQKDTKVAVVVSLKAGRYRLLAVSAKDGVPSDFAQTTVVVGDAPTPVPVPPPDPEPEPTPVPTVGPRVLTIIRETAQTTPAHARMVTALRTGAGAKYLIDKKHSLEVLDIDSVDSSGRPNAYVQSWKPFIAGIPLPVLIIADKDRNLLYKGTLPDSSTADSVLEIVKAHGG